MKKLVALVAFFAAGVAQAGSLNCTFTEGEGAKTLHSVEVAHADYQAMTTFELDHATGFIAVTADQAVVSLVLKGNNQPVSFHGRADGESVLGGTVYTQDSSNWISVICK